MRKVFSQLDTCISCAVSALLCSFAVSRSFGTRAFISTNVGTSSRTNASISPVTASNPPMRTSACLSSLSSYAAVFGVVSIGLLRRRPQTSVSKKSGVKVSLSSSLKAYEAPAAAKASVIEANLIDFKDDNMQVFSMSSAFKPVVAPIQVPGVVSAGVTGAVESSLAGRTTPMRSDVQRKRVKRRATSGSAGSRSQRRHIGAMLLERPSYEASAPSYDPTRVRAAIQVGTRSNCRFALASAREKSTSCSRTGMVSSAHRTRGSCREESKACWILLTANISRRLVDAL